MQIVIDIYEEDYAEIMYKKQNLPREMDWADKVIANGTVLPKGHGRLIDADDIDNITVVHNTKDVLVRLEAPTVLDADKGNAE